MIIISYIIVTILLYRFPLTRNVRAVIVRKLASVVRPISINHYYPY